MLFWFHHVQGPCVRISRLFIENGSWNRETRDKERGGNCPRCPLLTGERGSRCVPCELRRPLYHCAIPTLVLYWLYQPFIGRVFQRPRLALDRVKLKSCQTATVANKWFNLFYHPRKSSQPRTQGPLVGAPPLAGERPWMWLVMCLPEFGDRTKIRCG